jgi:hypothetical protein|tara:strand:- start:364 stop:624 length:261 start_codon:yes stop_codon:yes gene_type:complete
MPEAGPAIRLLQLTLKNIHGENGIFFLNAKGRLCATQRVTLTNVSEILQATNALSNIKVKSGMEDGFNPKYACGQFFRNPVARYKK